MDSLQDPRRRIPAIDSLLRETRIAQYESQISPEFIAVVTRSVVAETRKRIGARGVEVKAESIVEEVASVLDALLARPLQRVINATGVILHTGLGRAPLSEAARRAVMQACGYCSLEFDLKSGDRGDRQNHNEPLLRLLTGAESVLVVNNNAAALYLALNALAYRREVVVSRGQLIEIGGSFRLPDIMKRAGVKLVEVGTTNRTRLEDYRNAISPKTALLLRAHPSNYRVSGFTESVALADLVDLGRKAGIPVVDDLGNGLLWDWSDLGLPKEDNVRGSLASGADLVMVSGDKVLGGPQAGIIVGRGDLVDKLRKSPLARVVRPDKMTLAALAATLQEFLNRNLSSKSVPSWGMLMASVQELRARAEALRDRLQPLAEWRLLEVRDSYAEAGSGTLPAVSIPSVAVVVLPSHYGASAWASALRSAPVPVIATAHDDLVWMDMRTVNAGDEDDLISSVRSALDRGTSG